MLVPLTSIPGNIPWRYISLLLTLLIILQLLPPHHPNFAEPSASKWERLTSTYRSYRCSNPAAQPLISGPKEEYLALCLFIKDESSYLPEWLTHHYAHMNVSRFYIMDDASDPPLSSVKSYGNLVPRSALTFHLYHDDKRRLRKRLPQQLAMYEDCMAIYGKKHTWMGFIDVDEFLGIHTTETMEGILRGMESHDEVGALAVNWRIHTSAGLVSRPESARRGFDVCVDDEGDGEKFAGSVKSIVRTKYFEGLGGFSVHTFQLKNNTKTVGEDWVPLNTTQDGVALSWRMPSTRNRVALHHYMLRSREEFVEKMRGARGDNPRTEGFWEEWEGKGRRKVRCGREMGGYVP
jgi:hypothetical protein